MYYLFTPMIEVTLMTPFHEKGFSAKAVVCNATQERSDGTYLMYFPLLSDKAWQQSAAFH